MPELPEVETIARTLKPQISGRLITELHVLRDKSLEAGREYSEDIKNLSVTGLVRRAKLLIIGLQESAQLAEVLKNSAVQPAVDSDAFACPTCAGGNSYVAAEHRRALGYLQECRLLLVFHLKMSGRFMVYPENTAAMRHTKLIFDLSDGSRLFFDDMRAFGYCRIMKPEELDLWPFWVKLGPEPLDLPAEKLARLLEQSAVKRKDLLKAALLDQSFIAGVGNIYADEALFKAGLLPERRTQSLNKQDWLKLALSLQDVLCLSIQECGSSIRDYRDANGNAGAFQNCFAVYGRRGQTCRSCGTALSFCRIAGRATVYCDHCQK